MFNIYILFWFCIEYSRAYISKSVTIDKHEI